MVPIHVEEALKLLKNDGRVHHFLRTFEPREEQQNMMRDVIESYNQNHIALIEAGTGIGKSMAYLIPAIIWAMQNKERTVISTNTINLQEQLIHKDIPLILKSLSADVKAVLVKGMGNYLCLRKLKEAAEEKLTLEPKLSAEIERIEDWNEATSTGTRTDLPFVPSVESWERVCAEGDTCTYKQCPFQKDCYFFKDRKEAQDANILVANHSLLFADLNLKKDAPFNEEGAGFLPSYTKVILDEAHNVEDIATDFFSDKVSLNGLMRVLKRLGSEKQGKIPLLTKKIIQCFSKRSSEGIDSILTTIQSDLSGMRRDLYLSVADTFNSVSLYIAHTNGSSPGPVRLFPEHIRAPLWKEEVEPKAQQLKQSLERYAKALQRLESHLTLLEDQKLDEQTKGVRQEITALSNRLLEGARIFGEFISEEFPPQKVRWIDSKTAKGRENIILVHTDLNISQKLVDNLFSKYPTAILCSATLAAGKKMDFIKKRLGLDAEKLPDRVVREKIYQSPFDYQKQVLLTVPTDIPDPQDPEYTQAVCRAILDTIKSSRGGAFVLFTSYSQLNTCYQALSNTLLSHKYKLFKQGDDNRRALLNAFKESERSVLFGTDSFWQGVDVTGEALRLVILVKLPFQVPTEPIVQARMEEISTSGGNPFLEYAVPNAIVKFKQGFGRLIRHKKDRGCIVCLDPRLTNKSYGKLFLNSLPPCGFSTGAQADLSKLMETFYRKTYHLTKK